MAYVLPAVLVYQQLASAGGVASTTPDLDAVITGPLFNVIRAGNRDNSAAVSISAVVGGDVIQVQGNEIEDWAAQAAALTTEGRTYFSVEIPGRFPGQKVETAEAVLVDAKVQVNACEIKLPASTVADKNLLGVVGVTPFKTPFDFNISTLLPDGSGTHLQVGDLVTYTVKKAAGTDHDTLTGTFSTYVIGINADGSFRVANPLPEFTTADDYAVISVFRDFGEIGVPSAAITLADADLLGQLRVDTTAAAFNNASYKFHSGKVHVSYKALRTDLTQTIQVIDGELDREGKLGEATDENPLSLAVQLALANSGGAQIKAVAIASDDLSGYLQALDLIENERQAYALVPLTQSPAILSAFRTHVLAMSTPEAASWRVALLNSEIRDTKFIGQANPDAAAAGSYTVSSSRVFIDGPGDVNFVADGVTPGDSVAVMTSTSSTYLPIGIYKVLQVIGATRLEIEVDSLPSQTTGLITFYVDRTLTRAQQAEEVALASEGFNTSRVWHVQPDVVGVEVNGVTRYLPGYYLTAAFAGAIAGFPVQQGFTNVALAGITDLRHSNFYFSKTQLNRMAEAGTCLFVQDVQGGVPYCRHELTTDMTVLQYREIVKVKNADFLAYYYRNLLTPYIGSWNITVDTLNVMRQSFHAGGQLLMSQSLPKIGPPLLSYELLELEQDENNQDRVRIRARTETVTPNNYTDLYLLF